MTVLVIVIAVVLVAAGRAVVLLRRRCAGATPATPSVSSPARPRKRDRERSAAPPPLDEAPATGTRGRAGRRARAPPAAASSSPVGSRRRRRRACRPTPRPSASPAASSSTAASSAASWASASPASAPPSSPSCGRQATGGFGSKISVGKITDIKAEITDGQRASLYYPEGRMWITELPGSAPRQGRRPSTAAASSPAWSRRRRALPEVRAPRLPRAVVPHVAVVRVPVPRLAVQPGRREEGRPGAPRPRPLRHRRSAAASLTVDTGTDHPGPADRHQHHRPGGRGPPLRRRRRRTDAVSPASMAHGRRRHRSASSLVVAHRRLRHLRRHQHPAGASRRSAPRSSSPPTASRTTPTRSSRAASSTARSTFGLLGLFVIAIGLPLYWLDEPGRQDGRQSRASTTVRRPRRSDVRHHREGRLNCAVCHGAKGVGGAHAATRITDANGRLRRRRSTGRRRRSTPCCCATAARRSRYILTYGRPFSPMPAWGVAAAARSPTSRSRTSSTTSRSIQLTPKQAQTEVTTQLGR